eukprot:14577227-Alexandrium_andersonii.AAC.1
MRRRRTCARFRASVGVEAGRLGEGDSHVQYAPPSHSREVPSLGRGGGRAPGRAVAGPTGRGE